MLKQAKDSLNAFLSDSTQRVFALKGPWGVGKSTFVRNFLREEAEHLPPYLSYVSVFGLQNSREVTDTIRSHIRSTKVRWFAWLFRLFTRAAALFQISFAGFALKIPDVSNTAFWRIATKYGILIVLDDLERIHKELSLDQLLGLAASVTENSKAKVLLIFNEDKFEPEQRNIVTRYREKVIDGELEFRPTTDELVRAFLQDVSLHDTVRDCLEVGGGANLRIVFRINRAVMFFKDVAKRHGGKLLKQTLIEIAQFVWLYHVSPVPLTHENVIDLYVQWHLHEDKETPKKLSDEERAFGDLTQRARLQPHDVDRIVLEFLENGYLSQSGEEKFVEFNETRRAQTEYRRRDHDAYTPYASNFRATDAEATGPVEALLDDYADKIDIGSLKAHCDFLEGFDRPTGKWWRKHVSAVIDQLDLEQCKRYIDATNDVEARCLVEQRVANLKNEFDPKDAIQRIANEQNWTDDDLLGLATTPSDWYRQWLRTESGELLHTLRKFLRYALAEPQTGPRAEIASKVTAALRELGLENTANRLRVEKFLRIPIEEKQASESANSS